MLPEGPDICEAVSFQPRSMGCWPDTGSPLPVREDTKMERQRDAAAVAERTPARMDRVAGLPSDSKPSSPPP